MHKPWPPNGNLSQWILDQFPPGYRGYAIDVGASDGVSINTTWALEKHHGWMVVSVEANPDFYPTLKKERAWVEACALSYEPSDEHEFTVNPDNPEAFSALKLADHKMINDPTTREQLAGGKPKDWQKITVRVDTLGKVLAKWDFPRLDALCIDTEGTELDVLKGCDLKLWTPKVVIVESWDKTGPADQHLHDLGYRMKARNVQNNCFVLGG